MNYSYFDAHCDTIVKMYKDKASLNSSKYMVNINNLKKYSGAVQVFGIYNDGSFRQKDIVSIIKFLKDECDIYSDFISCETNIKSINKNMQDKKISAILSIESLGNQPDYNEDSIKTYFDNGVRIMSLCHNNDNILCGGIKNNNVGITQKGRLALRKMQSFGIILDVSHMSDISFWDAISEYNLPFTATHSNSRTICNNTRNLTDEQFVYLCKRGGLCGINFHSPFIDNNKADITSVIKHIEHFLSLGGENNICIGSDFDGTTEVVSDIENAGNVYRLFDTLLSINYNETIINKIAFNNFHNFVAKFETLIQ